MVYITKYKEWQRPLSGEQIHSIMMEKLVQAGEDGGCTPTKGWQRNLIPKKFRGKDSERFSLFRGRKCSFRGIPRFTEESIPKLGTEGNDMKKFVLHKSCSSKQNWKSVFVGGMLWNAIPRVCIYFSALRNGSREFSVPRNSRNSAGTNQLFRLFRLPRNNVLSEIANPIPPLSLYPPSRSKLKCTLQLRGQIHSPYFYSTHLSILWNQPMRDPLHLYQEVAKGWRLS